MAKNVSLLSVTLRRFERPLAYWAVVAAELSLAVFFALTVLAHATIPEDCDEDRNCSMTFAIEPQ